MAWQRIKAETGDRVTPNVDLVVLTRDLGLLHPEVERGFSSQHEVQLVVHRVLGRPSRTTVPLGCNCTGAK